MILKSLWVPACIFSLFQQYYSVVAFFGTSEALKSVRPERTINQNYYNITEGKNQRFALRLAVRWAKLVKMCWN